MAQFDNRYAQVAQTTTRTGAEVDEGLRAYMTGVYNYMTAGIALTGIVAYFLYTMAVTGDPTLAAKTASGAPAALKSGMFLTPLGAQLYLSPLKYVLMFGPLAFSLFLGFRIYSMSPGAAQISFWLFAALMGASLSMIFIVFKLGSIAQAFFITAAAYAALSLYGYTTKKDLSGWGTFLFMGLIGVIIAGLVNVFLQLPALSFALNALVLLISAGLTAYLTQQIKDEYYMVAGHAGAMATSAISGALSLYINFINMFTSVLNLFGDRE